MNSIFIFLGFFMEFIKEMGVQKARFSSGRESIEQGMVLWGHLVTPLQNYAARCTMPACRHTTTQVCTLSQ
jgi:hypothetical protein